MIRIVEWLNSRDFPTDVRSFLINVISDAATDISDPEPIAIPTSACANAAASLTPSPTIATILP